MGKNYVLTIQQESERDCFEPIHDRLKRNRGIIRQQGADYLAYALWDAIVDGYFPVLEVYGEQLEILETETLQQPSDRVLSKIYQIRRELLALRHIIVILVIDKSKRSQKNIGIFYFFYSATRYFSYFLNTFNPGISCLNSAGILYLSAVYSSRTIIIDLWGFSHLLRILMSCLNLL